MSEDRIRLQKAGFAKDSKKMVSRWKQRCCLFFAHPKMALMDAALIDTLEPKCNMGTTRVGHPTQAISKIEAA